MLVVLSHRKIVVFYHDNTRERSAKKDVRAMRSSAIFFKRYTLGTRQRLMKREECVARGWSGVLVALLFSRSLVLWRSDSTTLLLSGFLASWLSGSVAISFYGTTVLWLTVFLALWLSFFPNLWLSGARVLWLSRSWQLPGSFTLWLSGAVV